MKLLLLKLLALLTRLSTRSNPSRRVGRILVIKPDHLGDLLLAAPALRALREAFPAAQITALVGPWSRRMWLGCPDLDALIDLPFPGFDRGQGDKRIRGQEAPRRGTSPLSRTRERGTGGEGAAAGRGDAARCVPTLLAPYLLLLKYALLLRTHRYDAALLLRDDHWWGAALIALAGIPRRVGHNHPRCAPFLTDALPYDPREHVARQALAVVGRLIEGHGDTGTRGHGDSLSPSERSVGPQRAAATRRERVPVSPSERSVGPQRAAATRRERVPVSPSERSVGSQRAAATRRERVPVSPSGASGLVPWLPTPPDHAWAASWLAAHLAPGERLVVIHPGTGGPTKHWPPEGWVAVGQALSDRPGLRLLLTGGPGEGELVERIAAQVSPAPLTLAGKTSVGQLAALLGRAALVLGVDSGPLHIAVSQGAPTLHLFGPSDHLRFGPWGDPARHVVLRAALPCSPCGVFAACPRHTAGPECMALLTPQAVLAAIDQLL